MEKEYNRSYFNQIDCPTKAYWLGYILADGSINTHSPMNRLVFYCKKDDIEILENFANCIDCSHNYIKKEHRKRKNLNGYNFEYDAIYLYFDSKEIVYNLFKHGMNKKDWLTFKDEDYNRAFSLGFLDGDGGFSFIKYQCTTDKHKALQIHAVGLKNIMEGFSNNLGYHGKYISREKRFALQEKNIYRFSKCISASEDIQNTFDYFYKDIEWPYLTRKKDKLLSILNARKIYEEGL